MDRLVALGPSCAELGQMVVAGPDSGPAVGLTRGRYDKRYGYVDPNEDAAYAAYDDAGSLLAVADGHSGFEAAAAAVEAIGAAAHRLLYLARHEPALAVQAAIELAGSAVARSREEADGERRHSRTALTVVAIGTARVAAATVGDSVAVLVRRRRPIVLGQASDFMAGSVTPSDVAIVERRLKPGDQVVLATDGLTHFLGSSWPAETVRAVRSLATAPEAARWLIEAACEAGAGDNVAVVVGPRWPSTSGG